MADNTIKTRVVLAARSEAEWTDVVLKKGEIGISTSSEKTSTDTYKPFKFKIGDGETKYQYLKWAGGDEEAIKKYINDAIEPLIGAMTYNGALANLQFAEELTNNPTGEELVTKMCWAINLLSNALTSNAGSVMIGITNAPINANSTVFENGDMFVRKAIQSANIISILTGENGFGSEDVTAKVLITTLEILRDNVLHNQTYYQEKGLYTEDEIKSITDNEDGYKIPTYSSPYTLSAKKVSEFIKLFGIYYRTPFEVLHDTDANSLINSAAYAGVRDDVDYAINIYGSTIYDVISGENQVDDYSNTLAWSQDIAIANVDGTNITATLPANPTNLVNDITAFDELTIGKLTVPANSTVRATVATALNKQESEVTLEDIIKAIFSKIIPPAAATKPSASISISGASLGIKAVGATVNIPNATLTTNDGHFNSGDGSSYVQPAVDITWSNKQMSSTKTSGFGSYSPTSGTTEIAAQTAIAVELGNNTITFNGSADYTAPTNNPKNNDGSDYTGADATFTAGKATAAAKTVTATGVLPIYTNFSGGSGATATNPTFTTNPNTTIDVAYLPSTATTTTFIFTSPSESKAGVPVQFVIPTGKVNYLINFTVKDKTSPDTAYAPVPEDLYEKTTTERHGYKYDHIKLKNTTRDGVNWKIVLTSALTTGTKN